MGWSNVTNWFDALIGGSKSAKQGYQTPAIWNGLNKISGNLGILPMELKNRTGDKTEIVVVARFRDCGETRLLFIVRTSSNRQ